MATKPLFPSLAEQDLLVTDGTRPLVQLRHSSYERDIANIALKWGADATRAVAEAAKFEKVTSFRLGRYHYWLCSITQSSCLVPPTNNWGWGFRRSVKHLLRLHLPM